MVSIETRHKLSVAKKRNWSDPKYRENQLLAIRSSECREKKRGVMKKRYEDFENRNKTSEGWKRVWANPEMREKIIGSKLEYFSIPENRKKHGDALRNSIKFQTSRKSTEFREKFSGSNNPHWNGGIHVPYGPAFNRDLRMIVRKRDDYLCQNPKCYLPENGKAHDVHHIDLNKKNNNPVNLIVLCRKCHAGASGKDREYWTEYYQDLQDMRGISNGRCTQEEDGPGTIRH